MSKQSDAKAIQNYQEKPFVKTCSNCANYRSEIVRHGYNWAGAECFRETNMRCSVGGFAVKKTALCEDWKEKI